MNASVLQNEPLVSSEGSVGVTSLLNDACSTQRHGLQSRCLIWFSVRVQVSAIRNLEGNFQTTITLSELYKQFLFLSVYCQGFGRQGSLTNHINNNAGFFQFYQRFFFPEYILTQSVMVHSFRVVSALPCIFLSVLTSNNFHFNPLISESLSQRISSRYLSLFLFLRLRV